MQINSHYPRARGLVEKVSIKASLRTVRTKKKAEPGINPTPPCNSYVCPSAAHQQKNGKRALLPCEPRQEFYLIAASHSDA